MFHYKPFAIANVTFGIFLGINAYVAFSSVINSVIIWVVTILFTQSYWLVRYMLNVAGKDFPRMLFFPISIMFTFFTTMVSLTVIADILILLLWVATPMSVFAKINFMYTGVAVIAFTLIILIVGHYNARTPKIASYNVKLNKQIIRPFRIAMVADVHLKSYTPHKLISAMVDNINNLSADLVIFAGDLIDGEPAAFHKRGFTSTFQNIKSKFGTYLVLGNHEYYGFQVDKMINEYTLANLNVLRDSVAVIDELGIALVGRDDFSSYYFGVTRKSMTDLLTQVPAGMSIILIDHQPRNTALSQAMDNGVDLHLAGHTHNGQTFPTNLLMRGIYKNPWGIFHKGNYHCIVTCGFGTWGPNIRTFSTAEIVCINVTGTDTTDSLAKI